MIRHAPLRFGAVLLIVTAALGLGLVLGPILGPIAPPLMLLCAILLSARWGGLGPGLLATLVGVASWRYLDRSAPGHPEAWRSSADAVGLSLFALVGTAISLTVAALH